MNMLEDQSLQGGVDVHLQNFIETEARKQQFQSLAYSLTDLCWETCIDAPTSRLERKSERCLVNCVNRFIDVTNFITNRLQEVALSAEVSELTME